MRPPILSVLAMASCLLACLPVGAATQSNALPVFQYANNSHFQPDQQTFPPDFNPNSTIVNGQRPSASASGNGNGGGSSAGGNGGDKGSGSALTSSNPGNGYKGGAGVRAEGESTLYLGYETFQTDHFFNEEGDKKATGSTVYEQVYNVYYEIGVTQYDTLTANINYLNIRQTEAAHKHIRGFRDFEFGWKRLLYDYCDSLLSFNFVLTVPAGSDRIPYNAIRPGEFAETFGLLYSYNFKIAGRESGFDVGAAYRFYQGDPSDVVLVSSGLRCEFVDNFMIIGALDFFDGVGNGKRRSTTTFVTFADEEDFIDAEITNTSLRNSRILYGSIYLCYSFEKIAATIGTYRILWGRNCGAQTAFFGGLTFVF